MNSLRFQQQKIFERRLEQEAEKQKLMQNQIEEGPEEEYESTEEMTDQYVNDQQRQ